MRSLYFFLRPKFFVCLNLLTHTHFSLQGLILSNALRAQKDAEDEGCAIALSNLRSEVIELRNEGLEKDKILHSLINKIKEDEAALSFEDAKDPSTEASMIGGKFFTDIWDNGGREMAGEIIRRSEKGIHDAREVAKAAEKSAEAEGQLGIN